MQGTYRSSAVLAETTVTVGATYPRSFLGLSLLCLPTAASTNSPWNVLANDVVGEASRQFFFEFTIEDKQSRRELSALSGPSAVSKRALIESSEGVLVGTLFSLVQRFFGRGGA